MQQNERTYRQLHPRIVESGRHETLRAVLIVGAGIVAMALVILLLGFVIFGVNSGPHL